MAWTLDYWSTGPGGKPGGFPEEGGPSHQITFSLRRPDDLDVLTIMIEVCTQHGFRMTCEDHLSAAELQSIANFFWRASTAVEDYSPAEDKGTPQLWPEPEPTPTAVVAAAERAQAEHQPTGETP